MKSDEAIAAEQSLEQKLVSVGADGVRHHSFSEPPEAPMETGTPPEEPVSQPLRDEQGRFTAAQQEETVVEATPEVTPVEAQPQTSEDPAVAAFLAKYGGDVDKALQGAAHLAKKIGERDEKAKGYDELRAELESIKTSLQQQPPQYQQPVVPDQATVDWIDEQIAMNPASAQQFAVQALQAGQPLLYERVMESWATVQPRAASRFETALAVEQAKQEMRAAQPAASNDGVQMQQALTNVLVKNPEFNQYASELETVMQRYPGVTQGLHGSQSEKENAIETLFALAERDTLRALALSGATPAVESTTTDVVTPTTSEHDPAEVPAEKSPEQLFREQFRQEASRFGGERVVPNAYVAR